MDNLFWGSQQSFSSMYFIGLVDSFDMKKGASGHLKNEGGETERAGITLRAHWEF